MPQPEAGFILVMTERGMTYVSVMILCCLELWIFSVYDECEAFKKIRHSILHYFLERGYLWAVWKSISKKCKDA